MRPNIWTLSLFFGWVFAQYTYTAFFQYAYLRPPTPNVPDSVDLYLCISRSGAGTASDTLASSNFPFFYNTAALNFSGARIIYRNKFHNNNYYAPLTYTVSAGRVNVTVQRKIGYTGPGHTLDALDTLIGLRIPLYACGPQINTPLIWDSVPAAVLNSQLQSLKHRLRWANDTLALCPPLSATLSLTLPSIICPNAPASFSFNVSGTLPPDSFIISIQQVSPTPSSPVIYTDLVSQVGGGYGFSLTFPTDGTYALEVIGIDKKCKCAISLLTQNLTVSPLPPLLGIQGRDTVYAGATASYTLSQVPATASWSLTEGSTTTPLGNAGSQVITFSTNPPLPRVDTINVTYTLSGTPCSRATQKYVTVLPCPSSAGSIVAQPSNPCAGQSVVLELVGLSVPPDSLRWQEQDGSTWVNASGGIGGTYPIYITPPLPVGSHSYRVQVHYGGCVIWSSPITITIATAPLIREFYGLQTPVCVGDTAALSAEGDGIWITPDGRGSFTDSTDPNARYITASNDPAQISICWVIRPQDTTLCRDRSKDTICRTLTINPTDAVGSFSLAASSRRVCFGGRVQLTGQIIQGSDGFWFSDGTGSFSPSSTTPNAFYIPGVGDVGNWVHITWIVRGATCGFAIYEDSVFVEPGTQLRVSAPNQLCEGVTLALSALPTDPDVLWFQGSTGSVLASGGYNQSNPRFRARGPYYEVGRLPVGRDTFIAYLQRGSCESIAEFPLEIIAAPVASFAAEPTVTTMNNPRIRFTSQSQGAVSYTWDFGDFERLSTDSAQTVVEHSYTAPGTYSVVLYVENSLGCSDIYVCTNCIQILPRRVYLPNAFSPNGDGKNDAFRVLPIEEGFRFTRLEVFDRWGQVVFAGDNITEWKGEGKDGMPLDAGTYSYRAVILLPDEGLFTYTGVVHIVR